MRVLVIEDDVLVAKYATGIVYAGLGAEVHHVATVTEGLAALLKERPDVVTLDLELPDAFGLEALTLLREFDGTTPIVVVTGTATAADAAEAMRRGADAFILKDTVTGDGLIQTLLDCLERRLPKGQQIPA